jgi:glucose-1-phosphate adenylyltransferase
MCIRYGQCNNCQGSHVTTTLPTKGCIADDTLVQVGVGVTIKNAMLMGCDFYESPEEQARLLASGGIPMGVGDGSHIENAILDKNARIGKNVTIKNSAGVDEFEPAEGGTEQYFIRSGIVVVMKGGVIPDNSVI